MQVWRRTSRMLTVQRAESGGVVHVEFVGRVSGARSVIEEWHRGRASWPGLRDVGWQPQMLQHAPNDGGILDERDELEPPATAGTPQHVEPETPTHQLRPEVVAAVATPHRVGVLFGVVDPRGGGSSSRPPLPGGGSHRTVQVLFTYGSSGQRISSRGVSTAAGRFSTSPYPRPSVSWAGATICRYRHCSASDTSPRSAKYALRSPRSTAGSWLRAHRASRP